MGNPLCDNRQHEWGNQKKAPGAVCLRPGCGHRFGARKGTGAPPLPPSDGASVSTGQGQAPPAAVAASPAAPPVDELAARRARLAGLAARWQTPSADAPSADAPSADAPSADAGAVSPVESAKLAAMLREFVGDSLIAAERWVIEWRGFEPKKPDKALRGELHECVEVILQKILPDVTVGPWAKLGITMAMLYAGMRVGAPRKAPELCAVAPSPPSAAASSPPAAAPIRQELSSSQAPASSPPLAASGNAAIVDNG